MTHCVALLLPQVGPGGGVETALGLHQAGLGHLLARPAHPHVQDAAERNERAGESGAEPAFHELSVVLIVRTLESEYVRWDGRRYANAKYSTLTDIRTVRSSLNSAGCGAVAVGLVVVGEVSHAVVRAAEGEEGFEEALEIARIGDLDVVLWLGGWLERLGCLRYM